MGKDKPYSVEFEDRGEYLYTKVSGAKVTPEIALAFWREVVDQCEKTVCSKILLDHNFVEMIEMHEMVKVIGPIGDMLEGRMFAFYDRFGNYDIPEAGKVILRGMNVKMQIFYDLNEAERWLLAN